MSTAGTPQDETIKGFTLSTDQFYNIFQYISLTKMMSFVTFVCMSVYDNHILRIPFAFIILERDRKFDPPH